MQDASALIAAALAAAIAIGTATAEKAHRWAYETFVPEWTVWKSGTPPAPKFIEARR